MTKTEEKYVQRNCYVFDFSDLFCQTLTLRRAESVLFTYGISKPFHY